MVNFDGFRRRWIYHCPKCGITTTAFRDCGQQTRCCCGGMKELHQVIEPEHIEVSKSSYPSVQVFKPYFDVTMGREVSSKREINEYAKRHNMVYAGDKELTQQCIQNKAENERRFYNSFESGLKEKLLKEM